MKPEMITLKIGDATIKLPVATVAQLALASVIAQVLPAASSLPTAPGANVPVLGAYWPGEGGMNGGFVQARDGVPAHYLIFAKDDIGDHKWGGYEKESAATSKTDGTANTIALRNEDAKHPAASACAEHQADGHHNFYLPACGELYQGWLNTPELFAKDCYYWSSSQRSASSAFTMNFADGSQNYGYKGSERRVRPVRRLFI